MDLVWRKTSASRRLLFNGICRKHFLAEFAFLRYTKSIEFFCFGKDGRMAARKFKDLTIRQVNVAVTYYLMY